MDPIKKEANSTGGFKFGFGAASDYDKDEILVPLRVQEMISKSIRTLSNSMSNRSPHDNGRSPSLNPVEELEDEMEMHWYTLEEKAREYLTKQAGNNSPTLEDLKPVMNSSETGSTNPFRILKKDRD